MIDDRPRGTRRCAATRPATARQGSWLSQARADARAVAELLDADGVKAPGGGDE